MRAVQREASPRTVIEFPSRPIFRRMTVDAALAESPLVHVVAAMTRDALPRRVTIALARMAGLAGRYRVHPRKRKTCQVVVEANFLGPSSLVVAGFAALALLALVYVVLHVTAEAAGRERRVHVAAMAVRARHRDVDAAKR